MPQQERVQEAVAHDPTCRKLRVKLEIVGDAIADVDALDRGFGAILKSLVAHVPWDDTARSLNMSRNTYYRNKRRALVEVAPYLFGEFGRSS